MRHSCTRLSELLHGVVRSEVSAVAAQCFVVATLASTTPAMPFVFRNYEHPLSSSALAQRLGVLPGSSGHEVWQAVRASSAAPYYLDDFKCSGQRCENYSMPHEACPVMACQLLVGIRHTRGAYLPDPSSCRLSLPFKEHLQMLTQLGDACMMDYIGHTTHTPTHGII